MTEEECRMNENWKKLSNCYFVLLNRKIVKREDWDSDVQFIRFFADRYRWLLKCKNLKGIKFNRIDKTKPLTIENFAGLSAKYGENK